jgi:hypothetical protein
MLQNTNDYKLWKTFIIMPEDIFELMKAGASEMHYQMLDKYNDKDFDGARKLAGQVLDLCLLH